jgi:NAD(P)-dependent dehydrogenase (short-subunit alcohol dehydrogenase family)
VILNGKAALVTGAGRGLGRAHAIALAAAGARVMVNDLGGSPAGEGKDASPAQAVVDAIQAAGGTAIADASDVSSWQEAARLVENTVERFGRLDILVNNAGIFPPATTTTVDSDMFDRVYAVNVKAPFFLTAALAPAMAARGGGVILNLGSWVARLSLPVGALYASTKGAMETLTRAWSSEFGPSGVRVVAVSPGVINKDPDYPSARFMRGTPAGGAGAPEAIAHAAVFLASDEASFVHGAVLDVDGGRTGIAVVAA